jgi:hypothetical protein
MAENVYTKNLIPSSEAEKWRHLTVSTVFEDAQSVPELLNH